MKTFKEFFNEAETKPLSSEELSTLSVKDLEKLLDKVSKEAYKSNDKYLTAKDKNRSNIMSSTEKVYRTKTAVLNDYMSRIKNVLKTKEQEWKHLKNYSMKVLLM